MQKIYTIDLKTSPKNNKTTELKSEVLNNILNFSRSLEVLKSENPAKGKANVEINLN